MNILILTTHLNKGGVSRYVLNLAIGLKKRGNTVWVASRGGEWVSKLDVEGVCHRTIPIQTKSICSPKITLSLFNLLPFIKKNNIEIIHSNSRVTQCLGFFLSKLLKIPYISAFHGYYRPTIFRKLLKFAGTKTLAVSTAVKQHLIKDLNIHSDNIFVVYNGIDIKQFSHHSKTKADCGFNENQFIIGILGRISEEKGHFLAVRALKSLLSKHKNCYLLLAGTGKMENQLKTLIHQQNLQENIRFINWKAEDFLDILDVLIMPSKKEGFGYSIIEAFAKEIPVIGFNVGGISEIIKDKETGILFYSYDEISLQNAIMDVIINETLKRKIIAAAKERVKIFSLENMAENTEKVYKTLITVVS
ncbi:MAG: glycosyltransferase family 4 protein [Candidatus Omnitrophica bacterium]|nr:glycosyltransferase family 4 protein [Candidatus Omnitrophota bacterium]